MSVIVRFKPKNKQTETQGKAVAQELNAFVTQRVDVAPGLGIFRIVPDGWEMSDFSPGQFAVVGLPGKSPRCADSEAEEKTPDPDKVIKRAYSIASSSVAKEFLELYVALVPSGALTPRLFALSPGDRLWLGPKFTGMFTLDQVPEEMHLVLVATGTGLAPYMSMLRTQFVCGSPRHFAVFHGARHSWDLGYRSDLVALKQTCSNFAYVPCIDFPDEEITPWPGEIGWVQHLWQRGMLEDLWGFKPTPENTHVFLCGNPDMLEEMVGTLEAEGFKEHTKKQPGQIHLERYW